MRLRLQSVKAEVANQYLNTNDTGWLAWSALKTLLLGSAEGRHHATIQGMDSHRKPVIVRKFSRDWVAGYAGAGFGQDQPSLEILDLTGKVVTIEWEAVKWVCYVRDFPGGEQANPERLIQKKFAVRPRAAGLWLRMTLTDGEELEGLAANDRTLIEGAGLFVTPPDTRSNTQRIYVPRAAIETLEVVGMIGAARGKAATAKPAQPELFPSESDDT
jgi:hypothetical protein